MLYLIRKKIIKISGFLMVLLIWTIIYLSGTYNILLIPSPLSVFKTLFLSLGSWNFILNCGATFLRIISSFLIASFFGVSLGVFIGYYKILNETTEDLIDFIRSIPGIVLFPLFILFFGISELSKIMLAIFIAVPIIVINTKNGIIHSNSIRKNVSKIYRINKLKMFYKVLLPEASPFIFSGLKISLSLIIIVIIVAEMLISAKYGLGQLVIIAQSQFDTEIVYSIIIFLGCLGFFLNFIFNKVEDRVFHWKNYN